MAQPPTLPQVLAPQPVGTVQPVPSHLPPYLAPTSQVVAPAQLKPLQMPQPPLQPLAQVPPQVPLAHSLLTLGGYQDMGWACLCVLPGATG